MKLLQSLLHLSENEELMTDDDDDDDESSKTYELEKNVSVLILKVFRKCGISVAERESRSSGVRDAGDHWGYDILYFNDDNEATVTVEDVTMSGIVKLANAGLIDGDVQLIPTSDGTINMTFKVHANMPQETQS
ncbi:hypothetical protein [Acinetobacter sp.]|uniref:hypothetical protein n=1 Tax=Acinetobacter sp. TaxID=472 RepID=UPI00388DE4AA